MALSTFATYATGQSLLNLPIPSTAAPEQFTQGEHFIKGEPDNTAPWCDDRALIQNVLGLVTKRAPALPVTEPERIERLLGFIRSVEMPDAPLRVWSPGSRLDAVPLVLRAYADLFAALLNDVAIPQMAQRIPGFAADELIAALDAVRTEGGFIDVDGIMSELDSEAARKAEEARVIRQAEEERIRIANTPIHSTLAAFNLAKVTFSPRATLDTLRQYLAPGPGTFLFSVPSHLARQPGGKIRGAHVSIAPGDEQISYLPDHPPSSNLYATPALLEVLKSFREEVVDLGPIPETELHGADTIEGRARISLACKMAEQCGLKHQAEAFARVCGVAPMPAHRALMSWHRGRHAATERQRQINHAASPYRWRNVDPTDASNPNPFKSLPYAGPSAQEIAAEIERAIAGVDCDLGKGEGFDQEALDRLIDAERNQPIDELAGWKKVIEIVGANRRTVPGSEFASAIAASGLLGTAVFGPADSMKLLKACNESGWVKKVARPEGGGSPRRLFVRVDPLADPVQEIEAQTAEMHDDEEPAIEPLEWDGATGEDEPAIEPLEWAARGDEDESAAEVVGAP